MHVHDSGAMRSVQYKARVSLFLTLSQSHARSAALLATRMLLAPFSRRRFELGLKLDRQCTVVGEFTFGGRSVSSYAVKRSIHSRVGGLLLQIQ